MKFLEDETKFCEDCQKVINYIRWKGAKRNNWVPLCSECAARQRLVPEGKA